MKPEEMKNQRAKTIALQQIARMARKPLTENETAVVEYVKHLQAQLSRFVPGHMANVWRENERLKERNEDLEYIIAEALPYVEMAEHDELYKPGAIRRMATKMRNAITPTKKDEA